MPRRDVSARAGLFDIGLEANEAPARGRRAVVLLGYGRCHEADPTGPTVPLEAEEVMPIPW